MYIMLTKTLKKSEELCPVSHQSSPLAHPPPPHTHINITSTTICAHSVYTQAALGKEGIGRGGYWGTGEWRSFSSRADCTATTAALSL